MKGKVEIFEWRKRREMVKGNDTKEKGEVYAGILAGGVGKRFWPLSREGLPKQMLSIIGGSTLLEQTLSRIRKRIHPERTYIITTESYSPEIKRQFIAGKGPDEAVNLIVEPEGKNTAPAIGFAAMLIERLDPEAVLVILPSDHHIENEERFIRALDAGVKIARRGYLVTLGIRPTRPETGYGYIKIGSGLPKDILKELKGHDAFYVTAFTEKPDRDTAEAYLLEGCYYWNSGIFIWKASQILAEIKKHMPDLYRGIEQLKGCLEKGDKGAIEKIYKGFKAISIDYGVMEKSENVVLIPTDMGWSDLGSWNALEEIMEQDKEGNIIMGDCVLVDTFNSIFWGGRRLIAAVGLKDKVVVDTPDALLVCEKGRAQDVSKVVEILRAQGREESFAPKQRVNSYGSWTVLDQARGSKVVSVEIYPGSKLDAHKHTKMVEHLIVTEGCATIFVSGKGQDLQAGEAILIAKGIQHRIENRGKGICRIVQIQIGESNDEKDKSVH